MNVTGLHQKQKYSASWVEYLKLVARNDSLFSSKIISGNQLEILSWEIKRLDTSVMQNNSREIVRLVFCPENIL